MFVGVYKNMHNMRLTQEPNGGLVDNDEGLTLHVTAWLTLIRKHFKRHVGKYRSVCCMYLVHIDRHIIGSRLVNFEVNYLNKTCEIIGISRKVPRFYLIWTISSVEYPRT